MDNRYQAGSLLSGAYLLLLLLAGGAALVAYLRRQSTRHDQAYRRQVAEDVAQLLVGEADRARAADAVEQLVATGVAAPSLARVLRLEVEVTARDDHRYDRTVVLATRGDGGEVTLQRLTRALPFEALPGPVRQELLTAGAERQVFLLYERRPEG